MKHNSIIVVSAIGLTACSPQLPTEPLPVNIPYYASCLPEIAEPEWGLPLLEVKATTPDKVKTILADMELGHAYIDELKAVMAECK